MSSSITATIYYRRWAFLACTLLALVMGFVLYVSGFEEHLQSLPEEGTLLYVSEDALGIQDTSFHPAAESTLKAQMPQRGPLDNDADNDGSDDEVANSLVGLVSALLLTPLLSASFAVLLQQLPKLGLDYFPILGRPG
jgi:hypothetical protein